MVKAILKHADAKLINTLSEIAQNCLAGNFKLTGKKREYLSKYKRDLRCLSCSKRSVASKRKLLVQKGGAILPVILGSILASAASTLVDKYILNKRNE